MRVSTRVASVNKDSCSPSSRSVRNWFIFGPSLCKDVHAHSPSPYSASSTLSSSHPSPSPLPSSGRFSYRNDESITKSPGNHRVPIDHSATLQPARSRRRSGVATIARVNSQRLDEVERVERKPSLTVPESTKSNSAARRYALALADLANSTSCLDEVNHDVEHLSQLLANDELLEFLTSPTVLEAKKKSILRTIAEDVEFHECTGTFLEVLVERRRIHLIKDIVWEFEKVFNDLNDIQVATVTSAVKIDASQLVLVEKKIKSLSGAKNVRAKNVVDPSLIAGFVINYERDGSKYIDMSVKGQMNRLSTMPL